MYLEPVIQKCRNDGCPYIKARSRTYRCIMLNSSLFPLLNSPLWSFTGTLKINDALGNVAEVWVLFQCRFHPAEGSRVTGTELLLRMHVVHTVHTTSAPLHSVQLIMYRLRVELFFISAMLTFTVMTWTISTLKWFFCQVFFLFVIRKRLRFPHSVTTRFIKP